MVKEAKKANKAASDSGKCENISSAKWFFLFLAQSHVAGCDFR